ncbi:uncharacterized protein LOC106667320 [Cimex lectularius]|uniref:Uncharacterized protein n=1 Tax=Cimex lectularius TaxID=79782 RepID=A0A8I6TEV4_CIMLE|nr:uncharacterized protein LOC106667320 [Cimex lectularius]
MGQGILYILMLISVNFSAANLFYSTYSSLQERSKSGFLTLIKERRKAIEIYQECSSGLQLGQKKLLKQKIDYDLDNLQEDMNDMRSDKKTEDEAEKLYRFLRENDTALDESMIKYEILMGDFVHFDGTSLQSGFAKYEALLDKLSANIEDVMTEADLTTPYWKRVEKFITNPFNFLETLTNEWDANVQEPWSIIERKPNTCLKAFIVKLLTKASTLLKFYYACSAVLGRNAPMKKVTEKLLDFLQERTGRKELYFPLRYDNDMERALINYELIYFKLKKTLQNVDDDNELDIQDSKMLIDFLNDPFENSDPRPVAYNAYLEIARCYKIEMDDIIKQKERLSSSYQTCLARFGPMKQGRMRYKIKLYMMDFKMYTEKMRLAGNHENDVLLNYYDKYIANLPVKDLQQAFYKYEITLKFFANTLMTTEERLEDLSTKYWAIVRTFLIDTFNVKGIFSNATGTALAKMSVSASMTEEPPSKDGRILQDDLVQVVPWTREFDETIEMS